MVASRVPGVVGGCGPFPIIALPMDREPRIGGYAGDNKLLPGTAFLPSLRFPTICYSVRGGWGWGSLPASTESSPLAGPAPGRPQARRSREGPGNPGAAARAGAGGGAGGPRSGPRCCQHSWKVAPGQRRQMCLTSSCPALIRSAPGSS